MRIFYYFKPFRRGCTPTLNANRLRFNSLFKVKFGAYRVDKSLPHIRISSYSTHSKCDSCILIEKYQKSCKKEDDLEFAKSLKQRHKFTYRASYQAVQEKRFKAITDPENHFNIQGMESHNHIKIFKSVCGVSILFNVWLKVSKKIIRSNI